MPPVIDTSIPELLTGPGAGHYIGVSRVTALRMATTGRIPSRAVTTPPPAPGDSATLFVVFRADLITTLTAADIPADGPGEIVTDDAIPELLNAAATAVQLGILTKDVHQLFETGRLKGRPVQGAPKPSGQKRGRQSTSAIVYRPEEIARALRERTEVTEYRWAPARP